MKKFLLSLLIVVPMLILMAGFAYAGDATLSWDAPTCNADGTPLDDLAGYKLYYSLLSGNYSQNVDVGNVLTYVISGLAEGKWYFVATAYDTSNNESDYSNEVSKFCINSPTGVIATISSSSQINLAWLDNSAIEAGFQIERKEGIGEYILVATVGADILAYSDTGLTESKTYTYRIRSYATDGGSVYSEEVSATTLPSIPCPAENLQVQ